MNMSDLRPAWMLAKNLGVKSIVYGGPGMGKTPNLSSAPRPVLLACEPGLRSMAKSEVPTWEAYTVPRMDEFWDWIFSSAEAKNFDTLGVDSISQMAEMVLAFHLPKQRDPRKAYGLMTQYVYDKLSSIFYMQHKHVYLIAKLDAFETVTNPPPQPGMLPTTTTRKARPYFPGREIATKVTHLYDEILHMERLPNPNQPGQLVQVFRTSENEFVSARDRSGELNEIEPINLSALFTKAMK